MSSILVIADLHLAENRPDITDCFLNFLHCHHSQHQALYILGDLFETWLGDDDISPFTTSIANAIANFSLHTPVYFIHGNRDFLLGQRFAQRARMTLLDEQHQIHLGQHKLLLMHGDQLCIDDVDYQKFRKKSRSKWWQWLMLSLPLTFRRNKAAKYRAQSKESQMHKAEDIMDVAEREVDKVMTQTESDWLIHGHTHRPHIHNLPNSKLRAVVGDWYTQGSYLILNETGPELHTLAFSKQK